MTKTLVERLREPDWHDPACPWKVHCYCGEDGELPPHDRVRHPHALEAAARIEDLERKMEEIAKGEVPPSKNGHYLAHRAAVKTARSALSDKG